jgi:hypothetical protein
MPNKLRVFVRAELHGDGQPPSQDSVAKTNQVLKETFGSDILKLK